MTGSSSTGRGGGMAGSQRGRGRRSTPEHQARPDLSDSRIRPVVPSDPGPAPGVVWPANPPPGMFLSDTDSSSSASPAPNAVSSRPLSGGQFPPAPRPTAPMAQTMIESLPQRPPPQVPVARRPQMPGVPQGELQRMLDNSQVPENRAAIERFNAAAILSNNSTGPDSNLQLYGPIPPASERDPRHYTERLLRRHEAGEYVSPSELRAIHRYTNALVMRQQRDDGERASKDGLDRKPTNGEGGEKNVPDKPSRGKL